MNDEYCTVDTTVPAAGALEIWQLFYGLFSHKLLAISSTNHPIVEPCLLASTHAGFDPHIPTRPGTANKPLSLRGQPAAAVQWVRSSV